MPRCQSVHLSWKYSISYHSPFFKLSLPSFTGSCHDKRCDWHHLFLFQSWKVNRRTFPWCRPSTRRMRKRWTRRRGWPSAEGSQFYFSCSLSGTSFSDSPVTVQDMHSKFQNGTRSGEQLLEIIFTVIFFFPFLSDINATIQAAIKLWPMTRLISYRFKEVISMCIKIWTTQAEVCIVIVVIS